MARANTDDFVWSCYTQAILLAVDVWSRCCSSLIGLLLTHLAVVADSIACRVHIGPPPTDAISTADTDRYDSS